MMQTGFLISTPRNYNKIQIKMDSNYRINIISQKANIPLTSFWNTIFLWQNNPHLVNKRLLGISFVYITNIKLQEKADFNNVYLKLLNKSNIDLFMNKKITNYLTNLLEIEKCTDINSENIQDENNVFIFCIKLLLPRQKLEEQQFELIIIDKINNTVVCNSSGTFNKQLIPEFIYGLSYNNSEFNLWYCDKQYAETKSIKWLKNELFLKLIKWANEAENYNTSIPKSLSFVSTEKYCLLYHKLKEKYASKIINIWPENTDPLKFVYEDVAIATYLLVMWQQEYKQKMLTKNQTFIDLGCGNGLLVYILNQEGFIGYGIDVRSRNIWSMYPETTVLKVEPITPSFKSVYPNTDWLIGNHSDELTPWIPVMAARSSENCRFFVLPCCPYEFDGKKYQRFNSSQSQYSEYIDYVYKISEVCGFTTVKDKLRIPSTKRICLMGIERQKFIESKEIQEFIDQRCNVISSYSESKVWAENFIPRSNIEPVRNCTQIDRNITAKIVKLVTDELLKDKNYIEIKDKSWNTGGKLTFQEAVGLVPKEMLKELKNECGGLQTLLKNHHYIFKIIQGCIQFRIPMAATDNRTKKTQCWFQLNHPDGCLLKDEICRYKHC